MILKLKHIKYSLVAVLAVMFACTDSFEDINKNPSQSDVLPLENLIQNISVHVIPIDNNANTYQRQQNLVGDIYSGYLMNSNSFNTNNTPQYIFNTNWLNHPMEKVFAPLASSIIELQEYIVDDETGEVDPQYEDYYAVSKILSVAGFHRFSDMWGPISYSRLGNGQLQNPYDSQDSVYMYYMHDLDEAIDILTPYATAGIQAGFYGSDAVYGGDLRGWVEFANSLKLRLAVRMSYVEPALAQQYAEEAVNHSIGVITSNDYNAQIDVTQTAYTNPLSYLSNDIGDTRMGGSAESILVGLDDPRLPVYFKETADNPGTYAGIRIGITPDPKDSYINATSAVNIDTNDPYPWMVAAEVAFLKAEGALRGWDMGATAEALYAEGVTLSFDQNGVAGADTYLADDTSKPSNYTNPVDGSTANKDAVSEVTVKWDASATDEEKLEKIITQKWIALFPNGQEAWTEFRRTGYPKLFPSSNNLNTSTINTEEQIRRYPYPPSELTNNYDNYQGALELLGGPDTGGTKLWWDAK